MKKHRYDPSVSSRILETVCFTTDLVAVYYRVTIVVQCCYLASNFKSGVAQGM